jgi:hypothetical protein
MTVRTTPTTKPMTTPMITLTEKIVRLHQSLQAGGFAHAFGGALALAWCTERARGTVDIDCNIFVGGNEAASLAAALPKEVAWNEADVAVLARDGQIRLFWGPTPIDLFLNTTDFHEQAALRAKVQTFAGENIPFLSCTDLTVFKAFFNRTKDWADIEEMLAIGSVDRERVIGVLTLFLGGDDERVDRFTSLCRK